MNQYLIKGHFLALAVWLELGGVIRVILQLYRLEFLIGDEDRI